jgi:hypothetical protein
VVPRLVRRGLRRRLHLDAARVEAWNSIRGWSEYRSKLYGLFAPSKSSVEVLTKDAFTAELERMAAQLESSSRCN